MTGQRNFLRIADRLHENSGEKNVFDHFSTAKSENFPTVNFCTAQFFLYNLITNKAGEIEVAESNHIMKNFPSSL